MSKKIIVCQVGSRHRYLIPKVLEKNNLLYRLYTDTTSYSKLGRVASILECIGINSKSLKRLSARKPSIPRDKIFSSDILYYKKRYLKLKVKDSLAIRFVHYNGLEKKFISWGVGNADCVYSMYIENFEFLKYAKSQGLKIVVDIYETPMTYKYLIEEIQNNPEYKVFESQIIKYQYSHNVRMHYMEDLLALADNYTIPSQFVIDSMSEFKNFDITKTIFMPYASSVTPSNYNYRPKKHKLIWVGNDPIRKGLLYFAKAAVELKKIYPDVDCRVIGKVDECIKNVFPFSELNYIGVINKEQIMEEYSTAEAYVFPTLFEGFAGTIIEAASCGCPIITTSASGADETVFPGMFCTQKSVEEIVECVRKVFEDKSYQSKLSRDAFEYAKCLNPIEYEKRLISALSKI